MKTSSKAGGLLSEGRLRIYWLVRVNRRNRSIFYLLLFVTLASHFLDTGASPIAWMLLSLQFLLYPQLVYFLALRAGDQRQGEHRNQLLDGLWAGCWMAGLGFPLWISFTMFAGACLHMVVFYGLRGLPMVLGAMGVGAGMMLGLGNWSGVHFQTDLRTTFLSMISLTMFFVTYALDGYRRAMHQHASEMKLRAQFDEIKTLQEQLYLQAVCDPLTGLLNRRHLETALPEAIDAARTSGKALSLVVVDLDHFKRINDRHGHGVGDEVLKALAVSMRAMAADGDLIYRHGGEEFLIVLPGSTRADAFGMAERLRQGFAERPIEGSDAPIRSTLSCGIATFPSDGRTAQALLHSADTALYRAKTLGRNRSELYQDSM